MIKALSSEEELVEMVIDHVLDQTNLELDPDEASAAIAAIRPTIEREAQEKMLREVYKVAVAHAHARDPLGGIFDWLDRVSADLGLDLTTSQEKG